MASGQDDGHTRRYLLQTGAATLAAGLAGCAGGNGSNGSDDSGEEDGSDVDTTPEETAEPEPDYSLPESEHVSPVDMATEWMIFPDDQGNHLEAVALSPSALDENYDASFAEDIGVAEKYEVFEFNHTDIPETYVQKAVEPWESNFKVDQLPNNVSEKDVAQQLEDSGYSMQHQRGDFEVYAGEDGFHAVGNDRHIVVQGDMASTSQQRDLMFRVIEETNQNTYELPETIENGLETINEQDSLTISMIPNVAYMDSTGTRSIQPDLAMTSVNFEDGQKYGAWPFENAQDAETALRLLESNEEELNGGFENPSLEGKTVTASGGNYDISEMSYNGKIAFSGTVI